MGDSRRHRGPHPGDRQMFSAEALPRLQAAVADLSWLRTRNYTEASAIKLVGDRYQLRGRQRVAVGRCACAEEKRESRAMRALRPGDIAGETLVIDGLNVITTIEVALGGGVLLIGRDQCMRDMASFHGSYRLVRETERAVEILISIIDSMKPTETVVYVDRPVSNSGRLAELIRNVAAGAASRVIAQTADGVDETLKNVRAVVATADSAILDVCERWLNLARIAVERHRSELGPIWLLDLSDGKAVP
ncbi:MAG: DUF434 domain-containing protein [Deltaproteobacteria bacterium]|nr:DUF434 domain-containing protein [Deltaproteobacteria bacterium]